MLWVSISLRGVSFPLSSYPSPMLASACWSEISSTQLSHGPRASLSFLVNYRPLTMQSSISGLPARPIWLSVFRIWPKPLTKPAQPQLKRQIKRELLYPTSSPRKTGTASQPWSGLQTQTSKRFLENRPAENPPDQPTWHPAVWLFGLILASQVVWLAFFVVQFSDEIVVNVNLNNPIAFRAGWLVNYNLVNQFIHYFNG